MKESQSTQGQSKTSPEFPSFIPAQFRPSSQLMWRTPILIVSAMCASPPPLERRREMLHRLDGVRADGAA